MLHFAFDDAEPHYHGDDDDDDDDDDYDRDDKVVALDDDDDDDDDDDERSKRVIKWDEENRIVSINDGGGDDDDDGRYSRYVYDAGGERAIKYVGGDDDGSLINYVNAYYVVRGGGDDDDEASRISKHIFAGSQRIATKLVSYGDDDDDDRCEEDDDDNERDDKVVALDDDDDDNDDDRPKSCCVYEKKQYYYHSDHLGSSSFISQRDGRVYEHIEYFPFGETWVEESRGSYDTPYRFTGKEFDSRTGLYYYGARYYDPRTSVWQNPDPIIGEYMSGQGNAGVYNPQNMGLYTYTYNNPVNLSDPDGNIPVDTAWDAASIIWDVGKIAVGYATGNQKLVAEGGVDLAADAAALLIPYVPAGSTKVARMGSNLVSSAVEQRGKLRTALKTPAGYQAHHLLPVNILKKNDAVKKAVEGGLDFNGKMNGINLKTFSKKSGDGTHGSHPAYDKLVENIIERGFKGKNLGDMSSSEVRSTFEKSIIPELRGIAEHANKNNLNLNELSKTLNK